MHTPNQIMQYQAESKYEAQRNSAKMSTAATSNTNNNRSSSRIDFSVLFFSRNQSKCTKIDRDECRRE